MTLDESASNQIEFAGFSMGGNDGSSDEFIPIPADFFMNEGVDSIGFNLSEAPSTFGFCGTDVYAASFDVNPSSPYWNDMELVIDVLYVVQPGMVVIFSENAEIQMTNLVIDQPGRYTVHFGQIFSIERAQIYFDASQDGACFEIDSWGLRSLVSTWPETACGDADGSGGVDIDDVVYLIAYIFSGGPEPVTMDAGDADCSGGIDIDDVVYLIAYIFSGGPDPCASCD
jgi:hypothetical protein